MTTTTKDTIHNVIQNLLDGNPPDSIVPADCGEWNEIVASLYAAHADGGTESVRKSWNALIQFDSQLAQLIASEPDDDRTLLKAFERLATRGETSWLDAPADATLGLVSTRDLLRQNIPTPDWIVEDMIPERDLTFVVSDGGIGKSWLSLWLSETLSNGGRTFLGQYCEPCNVVYVDMELGAAWYSSRVRLIDQGLIEKRLITGRSLVHDVYYIDSPNITFDDAKVFLGHAATGEDDSRFPTSFDYLRAVIKRTKARLLIIDPIANLWGDIDENAANETSAVCKALRTVATDTGAAVVVAHHTNKGRLEERGSTAIRNSAGTMYLLTWAGNGVPLKDLRQMETSKARHSKALKQLHLKFTWTDQAMTIERVSGIELEELAEQMKDQKAADARQKVVDILRGVPEFTLNKGQLKAKLQATGLSVRDAEGAIKDAVDDGLVTTKKQGTSIRYGVAE